MIISFNVWLLQQYLLHPIISLRNLKPSPDHFSNRPPTSPFMLTWFIKKPTQLVHKLKYKLPATQIFIPALPQTRSYHRHSQPPSTWSSSKKKPDSNLSSMFHNHLNPLASSNATKSDIIYGDTSSTAPGHSSPHRRSPHQHIKKNQHTHRLQMQLNAGRPIYKNKKLRCPDRIAIAKQDSNWENKDQPITYANSAIQPAYATALDYNSP